MFGNKKKPFELGESFLATLDITKQIIEIAYGLDIRFTRDLKIEPEDIKPDRIGKRRGMFVKGTFMLRNHPSMNRTLFFDGCLWLTHGQPLAEWRLDHALLNVDDIQCREGERWDAHIGGHLEDEHEQHTPFVVSRGADVYVGYSASDRKERILAIA